MPTLIILVAAAAGATAFVSWTMSRRRRPLPFDLGLQEPEGAAFALHPEAVRDDRPPRAWSVIRIVLVVAAVGVVVAALAWAAGYLINEQLARMLVE